MAVGGRPVIVPLLMLNLSGLLRAMEFQAGWFADPIYFGKYPDSMIKVRQQHGHGKELWLYQAIPPRSLPLPSISLFD